MAVYSVARSGCPGVRRKTTGRITRPINEWRSTRHACQAMSETILECLEIGKRFGTTAVLSRIDLRLQVGRVTALMG